MKDFLTLLVYEKISGYVVKFRAQKLSVFQHQLFFNLVKELFKCFEALGWSVKLQIESKSESVLT